MIPYTVELKEEMAEILPDNTNIEATVVANLTTINFLSMLSMQDQVIVLSKMSGFNGVEISTILGCSESYVSQRLGVIKLYAKVILGKKL